MAGNKQTIEQFSIDVLLNSEGFGKQLQNIETRLMSACKRMEKQLTNAFNLRNKGAANIQKELNRVVMSTERAAKQMNRSLTNAFNIRGAGNNSFNQWAANAVRASETVRQAVGRANRGLNNRGAAGGTGGGVNRPRRTPGERQADQGLRRLRMADSLHAQQYGDVMARLQRGGHTEQISQFRSQLRSAYLQNAATGDMRGFRSSLREAVREQRNFLSAQRSASSGIGIASDGLIGKFGALAAGVMSLQKVIEIVAASVREGMSRQTAENRLSTSFGAEAPAVEERVTGIAKEFGLSITEALGQASTLRATLPREEVKNAQILDLLRDEAVSKVAFGMDNNAIDRLNIGLSQMMSAGKEAKVNAQDLNQIRNSMTEWLQVVRLGAGNAKLTKKDVLNMNSGDFFKDFSKGLALYNEKNKVYEKAREAFSTKLSNMQEAEKNSLVAMFEGESKGFSTLMQSVTAFFDGTHDGATALGEVFGWMATRIAVLVNTISTYTIRAEGYIDKFLQDFEEGFASLPQPVQDMFKEIGNFFAGQGKDLFNVAVVATGLSALAGSLNILKGALSAMGLLNGGAGIAAGAGSGLLAFGVQLYALYELAAHAQAIEDAGNNFINGMREKMGFGATKGFSEKAHAKDASALDKLLGYNPAELSAWLFEGIKDTPLMQGNWKGSEAYRPNVPLSLPQQPTNSTMTIILKGDNGAELGRVVKNMLQDFHETKTVSAASMAPSWGDGAQQRIPFPVQK